MSKPKIFIYYAHGNKDVKLRNDWETHVSFDTDKLFLMAAASWHLKGWQVCPFNQSPEWEMTGKLRDAARGIPPSVWGRWFTMRDICKKYGGAWFADVDVLNVAFDAETHGQPGLANGYGLNLCPPENGRCVWCSVMYLTPQFCENVIDTISVIDAGGVEVPPDCVPCGDENVIERYCYDKFIRASTYFKCGFFTQGWEQAPLLHFNRQIVPPVMHREFPHLIWPDKHAPF